MGSYLEGKKSYQVYFAHIYLLIVGRLNNLIVSIHFFIF